MTQSPKPPTNDRQQSSSERFGDLDFDLFGRAVSLRRLVHRLRLFEIGVNCLVVAGLVGFIWWSQWVNQAPLPTVGSNTIGDNLFRPLDQLSSVDIATSLANSANFAESQWVVNQAIQSEHLAYLVPSPTVITKPLVAGSTTRTRADIINYQTVAGDTVKNLATNFFISPDSIYWSNNIRQNQLPAGTKLLIPPPGLDGIVYRVKPADNLMTLAKKYQFDTNQVIIFNDLVTTNLPVDELIFIPNGRPVQVAKKTPLKISSSTVRTTVERAVLAGSTATCYGCRLVKAGEEIGKLGNTGLSTGPHIHLEIYLGNRTIDPWVFINQRANVIRPVDGYITQGYSNHHRGLDIANREGTPVKAIADGTIIYRGCLWPHHGRWATFGIIIDHGDFYSKSFHYQAPDNKIYKSCSINRGHSYGATSIDYSSQL